MQRDARLRAQPVGKAAPGPVLRATHQTRAQRVALYIPADMHQVRDALHRTAEVPALVHRALPDRVAMMMPTHRVGRGYPLHEPRERQRSLRLDDEVPMVAEDAVRQEAHGILLQAFFKGRQERAIVGWTAEDCRLSDASIDHVEILSLHFEPATSGHGGLRI